MTKSNSKIANISDINSAVGKFHLEADRSGRGMNVCISGIIGISDFSDTEITLKSHSGRIAISGKLLRIKVYESGVAEISGKVQNIGFLYGKS